MRLNPKEEIKYLVFDIESVPDSRLIKMVKYPSLDIDEGAAVQKFQEEILVNSNGASYFIPVTFQYPVAICIAKVREDFSLSDVVLLDSPQYRTREMVRLFWNGVEHQYGESSLVTFNGRGFDIPLLELMAYRYGITIKRHLRDKFGSRFRFGTKHIDLHDWLSNFNAIKMQGGLNLLAKILGKPGKMETTGDEVYGMYMEGKLQEINDYCVCDVLDTYFVFLRSRVILGELQLQKEQDLVKAAKEYIAANREKMPAFAYYLKNWGDWEPWPV
jgi:predicted PolB exonuclease-like 3'-5' exonuclease